MVRTIITVASYSLTRNLVETVKFTDLHLLKSFKTAETKKLPMFTKIPPLPGPFLTPLHSNS